MAKNIGQKLLENCTFISGCLWLVPNLVFEEVGFINEEYFMYVENIEFSQRVLERGYMLSVSQHSHVWHKVGGSSDDEMTNFSIFLRTRNWLLFMKKT